MKVGMRCTAQVRGSFAVPAVNLQGGAKKMNFTLSKMGRFALSALKRRQA
jgi:hypothetical protein